MRLSKIRLSAIILLVYLSVVSISSCRKAEPWEDENFDERLSGGTQTIFSEGIGAFSAIFPNLSADKVAVHDVGDIHFEATFVASPAPLFQGLGTIYNSNSCFNCHVNDGRGKPILSNEPMTSMLFRVSVPGNDPHGAPTAAPGFGGQLQDKSVFGFLPEASVNVTWSESTFRFADGDSVVLRNPQWNIYNSYIAQPAGMMYSARMAPPVHGLGLLEAVSENTINSFADENDADGDGISGKANYTYDGKSRRMMVGRFGWKAEAPTLDQQIAGAYNEDMGITNYIMPVENSFNQTQYDYLSDESEVNDSIFNAVVFYVRTLAVPARRKVTDPQVIRGKALFEQAKCASCHKPSMRTKTDVAFPEISNLLIRPYTDLLLHDMGPGLSDNRPTYKATGEEWRTPPLWGIGLTQIVNGHNFYLHDGRARNLMEAILWHGGEAQQSTDFVRALPKSDREALIAFLKSL